MWSPDRPGGPGQSGSYRSKRRTAGSAAGRGLAPSSATGRSLADAQAACTIAAPAAEDLTWGHITSQEDWHQYAKSGPADKRVISYWGPELGWCPGSINGIVGDQVFVKFDDVKIKLKPNLTDFVYIPRAETTHAAAAPTGELSQATESQAPH